MKLDNIKLWESGTPFFDESYGQEEPDLIPYLAKRENCGAVIVCPGGGYTHRADELEGEKIAERLNSYGISAFVLRYRVRPYNLDAVEADIMRAIRVVRYNSGKFGINPKKIAVLGFSAGAHVSVIASTRFDLGRTDGDEIDKVSSRPDMTVLCYGLTSLIPKRINKDIQVCCDVLSRGAENPEALVQELSAENAVDLYAPPMFIWNVCSDPIIPVESAFDLTEALIKNRIPFEFHVFEGDDHGYGTGDRFPEICRWMELAADFLIDSGF